MPGFGTGGAEMLVKNLLLFHDSNRFDVAACSLFPPNKTIIEKALEENNIKVFYLDKRLGPDPKLLFELYRLFKAFKPNIIHTHLYVLRYTLLPSLLCKIPVMMHTVHNVADKEVDAPGKLIHRAAFKFFKVYPVGISNTVSKTIEDLYKIKDVPYIYNGVPVEKYYHSSENRQKLRRLLNISDNEFVVIHIGRFSPQKNHKLLIEAFSLVVSQTPHARLMLVGDGELRGEIEAFANVKGVADKVQFLGVRKDVPELLSVSDLFVLSSDWEGVPLVILEAMAAAKPVVATAVGGVPELITDGLNGLLVKSNNVDALSTAMLKIISNIMLAQEMAKRGHEIVKKTFDASVMAKKYEAVYENRLHNR